MDGNIVVSGYHIYPAAANRHTFLLKFNPATGDTILYREYPNDHQTGLQVREFSNGDLLISVYDSDDPVAGYFIKTDAAGNFIWEKDMVPMVKVIQLILKLMRMTPIMF